MPMPQIAVEISAPDDARGRNAARSRELRLALLAACTDTAGVAECVDAEGARKAVAVALVYWQGPGSVHIEVSSKRVREEEWTERDLRFNAGDATIERWRMVGYAVGTVAGELVRLESRRKERETGSPRSEQAGAGATDDTGVERRGESQDSSTPEDAARETSSEDAGRSERKASEPEESRDTHEVAPVVDPGRHDTGERPADAQAAPGTSTRSKQNVWWAEAGALGGPGPYGTAWRLGAYARVSRVFDGPFVTASFGYAARSEDERALVARWITTSAGAGYAAFIGRRIVLDVRGEFAAEHLAASVGQAPSRRADSAGRWMAAFRAGGDVAWNPFDQLAFLVGAEATFRPAATDVIVGDEHVGAVQHADYAMLGGMRLIWP